MLPPIQTKPQFTWLNQITIIDLSSLLPAPFCAHLLANLGARVIKIESPNRPDPARNFGFVPDDQTTGSAYRDINAIKEEQFLDLKNPKDREQLYTLVKKADAVIEGYRPEVRGRLGIDYTTLQKVNPKIVVGSIVGYHPKGPLRDRAGHDINFVARSGILDLTRSGRGEAVMPGAPLADYSVAYATALRVLAAIFSARSSGNGCHVEVSIEEILLEIQRPFLREIEESGEKPRAGHTLVTGKYPCYRVYEHPDGAFAVGALEEKFWIAFCECLGRPDLIPHAYETGDAAIEVTREITVTLMKRPYKDWLRLFASIDCCVEPVLNAQDIIKNLQRSGF